MRKLFVSLAALAAIVGCSKVEEHNTNVDSKQTISLSASIELDDTRVAVVGEKFTEVSWEIDDAIRLVSQGGVNADLKATTAGRENVIFCGDGEFKAAVDTYYAVHPATDIVDAKVAFDYAQQSGDDFVSLVAKGEGRESNDLQLSFKPVNSLLHVAVSGVESLAKAEFKSFDGSDIASSFSYDFSTDETTMGGSTKAYVVEKPAVEGFFFSLPANLDMTNGYIVTLTDGAGNVCSKAYKGKVFERGTTTRVAIEWSQPIVTFGSAMTSYSYYLSGNSAQANSCANNVIYFMPSTYANLQGAMIAEAGYIVDGKTYAATIDTATKSFSGNVAVSSWGAKSVKTYVKTKDGKTFESEAETVHITGLPYTLNITKNDGNWTEGETVNWNTDGGVRLGYYQWGGEAYIENTKFSVPADVNIVVNSTGKVNGTGSWIKVSNTVSISVSGSGIFSKSQKGNSPSNYACENKSCTMKASNAAVKINSSYNLEQAYALVKTFTIKYGNK